ANILNPEDEGSDFENVKFTGDWFTEIATKRELEGDLEWLAKQIGNESHSVALALTKRWQSASPPKLKNPPQGDTKRPNGRVLRVLRRPINGLLLIYPLLPPSEVVTHQGENKIPEPTGLSESGPPVIGVALSFPVSAT